MCATPERRACTAGPHGLPLHVLTAALADYQLRFSHAGLFFLEPAFANLEPAPGAPERRNDPDDDAGPPPPPPVEPDSNRDVQVDGAPEAWVGMQSAYDLAQA